MLIAIMIILVLGAIVGIMFFVRDKQEDNMQFNGGMWLYKNKYLITTTSSDNKYKYFFADSKYNKGSIIICNLSDNKYIITKVESCSLFTAEEKAKMPRLLINAKFLGDVKEYKKQVLIFHLPHLHKTCYLLEKDNIYMDHENYIYTYGIMNNSNICIGDDSAAEMLSVEEMISKFGYASTIGLPRMIIRYGRKSFYENLTKKTANTNSNHPECIIVGVRFPGMTSGCYYYRSNKMLTCGEVITVPTSHGNERATVVYSKRYGTNESLPRGYGFNDLKIIK